ncbi:hypothetical protein B0T18DRAFT_444931 [Schizothecium vesticola]|uniref:Uncharacterized protein n=1 Tax=Schizothecium vesticola TaxID=314040 RepID=A0AA40F0I1_9PEZI|nr:hypothetical protein B0T18DRAFT_444931 [Schizothecium vesticola]
MNTMDIPFVTSKTPDAIDPLAEYHVSGFYKNRAWGGFHHLAELSSTERHRQNAFRALSLTSRRMRILAQPFLYRAAVVRCSMLPYLARTLATPNGRYLAESVRVLCLLPTSHRPRHGAIQDFERPTWSDPDILDLAAAYSVKPPPRDRPLMNRTCADMLAFETKLLAISTAMVLKKATALERFRVVPLGLAHIGALPGVPYHKEISLSLRPLSRHDGDSSVDSGPDSERIDQTLLRVLPRVLPLLHSTATGRFPDFREYIAGPYPEYHDLLGLTNLVAAARDIESVSCLGPHWWNEPWLMERRAADGFGSQEPFTALTSLDLTECSVGLPSLSNLLQNCLFLEHLKVHFAEAVGGDGFHAALVLEWLGTRGVSSRLTSLDLYIEREMQALFNHLLDLPGRRVPTPVLATMASGWDDLEYLDIPADVIWAREGSLDPDELKDTQRLVDFLPRTLRTLAVRDINAVPVVQLEALAAECGSEGTFPALRSVLLQGPRPMQVKWSGGDVEEEAQDGSGGESAMSHSHTTAGKPWQEVLPSGAGATSCTCRWKKRVENQRPALEKMEATFKAQGVRISITPGFLWEGDGSDSDGPSGDGDDPDSDKLSTAASVWTMFL